LPATTMSATTTSRESFRMNYDLVIEKAGAFYNASWLTNGRVSAGGIGMEVENGLAIGWRRIAD
jgi:hypothetical protein